ncbi:hypothetical protein [Klebsiella aerogenes]|uniref:hypothetical protein n=1 Tax=Klebsiella aerogenes TaxID=548 RepID=UPI001E41DA30|nr:hypothetical protein [Klebsiella aerogenes]
MIQRSNLCRVLLLCLTAVTFSAFAESVATPVANRVLQDGFPHEPASLASTTTHLFKEYERTNNVGVLIFYSWGMLRQAAHYQNVNDLIHASEYAKTGFFYLDESVDTHEDNLLIRYLRARVDAWLPANLGRCVITIGDTDSLMRNKDKFSAEIVRKINEMRLRALHQCHNKQQEEQLLQQLRSVGQNLKIDYENNNPPPWEMAEVLQVIVPVIKGD